MRNRGSVPQLFSCMMSAPYVRSVDCVFKFLYILVVDLEWP